MATYTVTSDGANVPGQASLAADFTYGGVTYPAGLPTDDVRLLIDFNQHFTHSVNDPTVVRRVLGSRHVAVWYAGWKAERAAVKAVPAHWVAAGLTAQEWMAAQTHVSARRTARTTHAAALEAAAVAFRNAKAAADAALATAEAAHADPMARVLEAGYEQLALADQLAVEAAPAADREQQLATRLAAARIGWLADVRAARALPF
nr:hypothetical protein [Phytophthora cactorum usti-like virus 1]